MRVRMRTRYANAERIVHPGKIVDLPDEEAKAIIAGKYGEPVKEGVVAKVKRAVTGKDEDE